MSFLFPILTVSFFFFLMVRIRISSSMLSSSMTLGVVNLLGNSFVYFSRDQITMAEVRQKVSVFLM